MNRKGSVRDIPIILIMLFALAMTFVAFQGLSAETHNQFKELNESTGEDRIEGIGKATEFTGEMLGIFALVDAGTIVLFFMFFLASIYAGLQINASKLFALPSFFFLIAALYVAGILSDTFLSISKIDPVVSWFNAMPITVKTFANLPVLSASLGTVLFIAVYIRTKNIRSVGL